MTEPIPTLANPVYRGERCRSCNVELVFVLTAKRKREPLERKTVAMIPEAADAIAEGAPRSAFRVVAIVNGQAQSLGLKAAAELGLDVTEETPIHVSHFATCPKRDRFRRSV